MPACRGKGVLGCADLLAGNTTITASGTGLPSLSTTETDKLPAETAIASVEKVMIDIDFFITGRLCKMSDCSLLGLDDVTMHRGQQAQYFVLLARRNAFGVHAGLQHFYQCMKV